MPGSVSLVREVGSSPDDLRASIALASNLSELIDLIPAPFQPRARIHVNDTYNAAKKSNYARSYLASLEKHKVDNTFPPEIGGRVHTPVLQISKEYSSSATWKSEQQDLDNSTLEFKKQLLDKAISVKKHEIAELQSRFAPPMYSQHVNTILTEVGKELLADAGGMLSADGSIPEASLPDWAKLDYAIFRAHGNLFFGRAIALAHAANSKEMSKKFKSLSLKQTTDKDVEMKDAPSTNDTIRAIVAKELAKALQANNMQQPGKGNAKKRTSPKKKQSPPGGVPVPQKGVKKRGSSNGSSRGRKSNRSTSK